MRIVIGEDSALMREGLIRIFEGGGFEVVGQAADADDLRRKVRAHKPDMAVVDVQMPPNHAQDGLEAAIELRGEMPGLAVLVLSSHIEEVFSRTLLAGNAKGVGYLLKDRVVDVDVFLESARRVASGGSALDPEVVSELLGSRDAESPLAGLTERELTVLGMMAEGNANAGIARQLNLSERAIERHVTAIFSKLDLQPGNETHRRVLAVRTYLQDQG